VGLDGTAALLRQLEELGKLEDGKALRSAVRAGMKPAMDRAKAMIPQGIDPHKTFKGRLVAPGFAKRSIRVVTKLSKDKQKASAALGVRAEAFYAVNFVELGTSKMAARPWLRPAFASTLQQQTEAMSASLRKSILKAAKKK
jgi:HK97 gp10 family phage protein